MALLTKYRFTLDPGSKKIRCPACNQKRFVRYLDNETGNYLPDDVGRCDREISCGYHKPPSEAGLDYAAALSSLPDTPKKPVPSYLPLEYVERSEGNYQANLFISWLATLPGWNWQTAEAVARFYKVGTGIADDVEGWAIFWQIDQNKNVRSGKMVRYDSAGHRMKHGYSYDWIHSRLKKAGLLDDFELVQCLFGLHIIDDSKPVAIVESEKTAIICSQYLPVFHWLAAGQLNGLNEYKIRPLKGRSVTFFPDIGAFDLWEEQAREFSYLGNIQVSDLLERKASDREYGYDLADYLIHFDLDVFRSGVCGKSDASTKHIFSKSEAPYGFNPYSGEVFDERGYPADWDAICLN